MWWGQNTEAFSLLFHKSTKMLRKFCLQKLIKEHIKFCSIFDKKQRLTILSYKRKCIVQ